MRRMSFALTVNAMLGRSKTVTRRRPETWKSLSPGDELLAVEKAMGLKKGEKHRVLGRIEVVDVRVEPLACVLDEERGAAREGFPDLSEREFVAFVQSRLGMRPEENVRRIEFRHITGGAS